MGTNLFQREYIEYLQDRNTELLNKLNNLKENYETKILAKDLNKHYLMSALEDMLNVCTAIPQEIDLFFDKMTAAMGAFKNILLRKSEMVQLVEKISKVITPTENIGNDIISVGDSGLAKEQITGARVGRKAGTVKVSPMINGHIISTEPRIHLSRVPGFITPVNKNETHQLSPIIEASPDTSSDPSNSGGHVFREVKIPLERINLSKMSYNYLSEESPKSRFKGPKTWKKSLSSNTRLSGHQKNSVFLENNENLNKKFSTGEVESPRFSEDIDPLEGPSWLCKEIPDMNSSSSHFIDYRRRKHRFATVFDNNEDCINYFEKTKKSLEEDSSKFYESNEDEDDERELEESERRVSDSSEDFINESFTNDDNSPKRRKCQSSRRTQSKKSNLKNAPEYTKEVKKESLSALSKNEERSSTYNNPTQCDSSDDDNNEKYSVGHGKQSKKSPVKSSMSKKSAELSFEETPSRTEHVEGEIRSSKNCKNKRRKETSAKDITENGVFVKLENCVSAKGSTTTKSRTRSPSVKKKSDRSKSQSKSKSPVVLSPENEGRKKRKAAPSFKLVEPNLVRKLRRS